VTNVLFVCRQNAGRSQIAHALYERRGGRARSAGTTPAEEIHAAVLDVMPELERRRPHALTQEDVEWADLVVTMGCGDECPVMPGKRYVDWNLADPAGMCREEVVELRDAIARRVAELPL
jgi:arsenate reductase